MWILYALIAATVWGLNYSLDEKILQNNISPFILLAIQAASGIVVYMTIIGTMSSLRHNLFLLAKHKPNLWLLAGAALASIIANIFICLSIKEKNATAAGILELTYPLFTILFTYLLFKQVHLSWSIVSGGLLIFLGVIVIILAN